MLMRLPFLLSALITLLSHFVRHNYVPVTSSSSAKSLFDYSKDDWTGLLEYFLNYNFDLLFHDDDIDIVWQSFKDLFLSSFYMYVPVVVTHSAAKYIPWGSTLIFATRPLELEGCGNHALNTSSLCLHAKWAWP